MADERFLKERTRAYQRGWDLADQLSNEQFPFEGTSTLITDNLELRKGKGRVKTVVRVVDADPLVLSNQLETNKQMKVAIINSGCPNMYGGGVKGGQPGTEEDLCRRSNYYQSLRQHKRQYAGAHIRMGNVIHVQDMDVFLTPNFDIQDETFPANIISVMVAKSPSAIGFADGRLDYEENSDRERMLQCLTNAFRVAEDNEYQAVILNGVGIGMDRHPINGIANVLNEVLTHTRIKYVFYIYEQPSPEDLSDIRAYRTFYTEIDNRLSKEEVRAKFGELEGAETRERELEDAATKEQLEQDQAHAERQRLRKERRRKKKRLEDAKYRSANE
jgi:uncharacterized protein (TIGR02452 family)